MEEKQFDFFEAFMNGLREVLNPINIIEDSKIYDYEIIDLYSDSTLWTEVIKLTMEVVHREFNKTLKKDEKRYSNLNNEYFKIDHSFWTEQNTKGEKETEEIFEKLKLGKGNMRKWNLEYAIEHENSNSIWPYEMKQLMFFKTKKKVLITYLHEGARTNELAENLSTLLTEYEISPIEGESFTFILGFSADIAKQKKEIKYLCFEYKYEQNMGGIWKLVTDQEISDKISL